MVLAMARPWKHPKTGIFWLRRRVPADLVPVLNRREEKRTLGTRDPAEAKKRHAEALAELERRWDQLRTERQPRQEAREASLSERRTISPNGSMATCAERHPIIKQFGAG